MVVSKVRFRSTAKSLGIQNPMESMAPEDRLRVAEHLKSQASDDFKMPKLKLDTRDISKIGLIEVDGKMITIEELENLKVVKGDLDLSDIDLTELPDLSHLEIIGDFWCHNNHLTTLRGAPKEVGGNLYCYDNDLTSLDGAPQEVGGDFDCNNNKLTSLEGAPRKVGGDFWCQKNRLTTLEGAPREVGAGFFCSDNELISLRGAPERVGGRFDCSSNRELATLEGAPKEVGDGFWSTNNKRIFTVKEVEEVSDVKGLIIV